MYLIYVKLHPSYTILLRCYLNNMNLLILIICRKIILVMSLSWNLISRNRTQRPRIDLNKIFLPRPNTTTA